MKKITVFNLVSIAVCALVYQCSLINAQTSMVSSPLLDEIEQKKALFYNRKASGNGEKIKVVYVRVPSDEQESGHNKRTRRHSGTYWRMPSYGQPPLNPTGPPPGLFSPGSPYNVYPSPQRRRIHTHIAPKSKKPKYRLKPTQRPIQSKTPCPYKLIAEELAAEAEEQRHIQTHYRLPPPPPTTTTTTPPPPTPPPTPSPIQTIYYQNADQQPSQIVQYETLPQEIFQSQAAPSNDQYPILIDQNGQIIQQQQQNHLQTIAFPQQQQQLMYRLDTQNSGSDYLPRSSSSSSSPFLITQQQLQLQQQQQNLFGQQDLQSFARLPGVSGNQIIFERQASGFPHQQQQQVILLDNSQVAPTQPTTVILPSGQVVQTQQKLVTQPQHHQQLVLLNTPSESQPSALSFLQPGAINRQQSISFGHSNLPLLQDFGGLISDSQPLLSGGTLRQRNRIKPAAGSIPLLLPPPPVQEEEEELEEEPIQPLIIRQRKKERRRQNPRNRDKKRFVIIPKKELDQIKNKKNRQHLNKKNLPPPPEVIHIPFHESTPEEEEEEYYDENNNNNQNNIYNDVVHHNLNGPLSFQAGQQQQQKIPLEEASLATQVTNDNKNSGSGNAENLSESSEKKSEQETTTS